MLQNRIEQLEQLLEENHEIISHIKDSVLELTAHTEGQPALPHHTPNGSWVLPPESRPSFLSVSPQDCQFALGGKGQSPDLQVRGRSLGAAGRGTSLLARGAPYQGVHGVLALCCWGSLHPGSALSPVSHLADDGCVFPAAL